MKLSAEDKRFLDLNFEIMKVLVKHADPISGLRALIIGTVTGAIEQGLTRDDFLALMGEKYDRLSRNKPNTVEA